MAEKDKIGDFIHELYGEEKDKPISKEELIAHVSDAEFPADMEIFFKDLPDQSYDESQLVDSLNDIISKRNRTKAVGGMIEK